MFTRNLRQVLVVALSSSAVAAVCLVLTLASDRPAAARGDGWAPQRSTQPTALPVNDGFQFAPMFMSGGSGAPGCVGDVDGSGVVDVVDFLELLGAWGPCPAPPDPCPADFDKSGSVDVVDFLALLGAWGPCP